MFYFKYLHKAYEDRDIIELFIFILYFTQITLMLSQNSYSNSMI